MADSDDDVERWQRIRDRQIAARDPTETRKQRNQRLQKRHGAGRKPMTLKDVVKVLSNKVIGLIIGILLGFVGWIVLTFLFEAWWVDWAGLGLAVLFAAIGVVVGASFDWRDELRDF